MRSNMSEKGVVKTIGFMFCIGVFLLMSSLVIDADEEDFKIIVYGSEAKTYVDGLRSVGYQADYFLIPDEIEKEDKNCWDRSFVYYAVPPRLEDYNLLIYCEFIRPPNKVLSRAGQLCA